MLTDALHQMYFTCSAPFVKPNGKDEMIDLEVAVPKGGEKKGKKTTWFKGKVL